MIQIKNLSKNFRTEEVETIALNGTSHKHGSEKGRIYRHHGDPADAANQPCCIFSACYTDNPDEGSYLLEGEVGHLKEKDRTRAIARDALVSCSKASISLTSLQSRKT